MIGVAKCHFGDYIDCMNNGQQTRNTARRSAAIVMIDYGQPLTSRKQSRKSVGPYMRTPTKAGSGRGFYQHSNKLAVDERGSSFRLRLMLANDVLTGSRLSYIDGYYCDDSGFGETLQPIIARLNHERGWLAGWTMGNGMAAYVGARVFGSAVDAASAAHDTAKRDAEREREYQAAEDAEESE